MITKFCLKSSPRNPCARPFVTETTKWYDIVNFSVLAMIAAEELGVTSKNVDAMLKSKDPKIQRFLGVSPGNGKALGVDEDWAYKIVKLVGNYGEVFERNVGVNTPLKIERGLNAQWTNGGLDVCASVQVNHSVE